jgi:hypothetical protein
LRQICSQWHGLVLRLKALRNGGVAANANPGFVVPFFVGNDLLCSAAWHVGSIAVHI